MTATVYIYSDIVFEPVLKDKVSVEWERKGAAGKMSFTVVNGGSYAFYEGDAVSLKVDDNDVFFGYIFTKSRDKNNDISIIAYDQLRYLKNKDTLLFEDKTAADIVKGVAKLNNIKCGEIADTSYIIPSRSEENSMYLDMIQNALDDTLLMTKKMYVLYDDYGKLTLKDAENMKIDVLLDSESAENYNYESTIDNDTYNQIKLVYNNENTGKQEVYIAKNSEHINEWGLLQYFDTIEQGENGKNKADEFLSYYDRKKRTLSILKTFGDIRVRGGSYVPVWLNLGDTEVKNFMLVEKVTHDFEKGVHTMNLTLRGGDFVA